MKNAQQAQHVANAIKTVRAQIEALREQIKSATGDERIALQAEANALLESIGVESSVGVQSADNSTAGHILGNINAVVEKAGNITGLPIEPAEIDVKITNADGSSTTTHTTVETKKAGLWTRFKLWCAENKKKVIFGAIGLAAGAAGLWFWINGKNTVNVTSSATDVIITAEPTIQTGEADPSIFERVGAWVVGAAGAVKGYAVNAWSWVKGLFNRNNNTEVNVEVPVQMPLAA